MTLFTLVMSMAYLPSDQMEHAEEDEHDYDDHE
jgi:hypothetical protein